MEIAPDAVEVEPSRSAGRFAWATDNPLGRAIGRIPLPLGAKLVAAFSVIAALLAVGYALGFVALRQSNVRSDQLRRLQQRTAYEQLLLSDATQLKNAVYRLSLNRAASPTVTAAVRGEIGTAIGALCLDAGLGGTACLGVPRTGLTLAAIDPSLLQKLRQTLVGFGTLGEPVVPNAPTASSIARANQDATFIASRLTRLAHRTSHEARALVAQNHSSYDSSRNLLVGVGAGTLVLVLGLGLILSGSVVVPIRRTRMRLAGIAAGDFSTQVEVPNRDEIGELAADVNNMSEELQRVHRELELASEHKSQFLTNMSHELRTPLNAIIGFSEVLKEQMFGELNERQLAYVNDVLEAGKHLLSLINDLLDLAKIEAGRMELELSQVAIPEILRGAVSMHSERASRGGIELVLNTEPDEITVTADERRVRQIVVNLLSNAVKFTPAHGRIDVSARRDNGNVEVAVSDTGPGIAAGALETIFEEFEQTEAGRQAEGTGLGLPLSRRLAERHGGRLWAESEPGHGSTFRFTLPVEAAE
jgi:signal transduction histidine kinase